MSTRRIPFSEKLIEIVGPVVERAGFKLAEQVTDFSNEAVVYKRHRSENKTPEQIVFHKGGPIAPTNSLYVEVHASKANLVTLKELLLDAPDLSQKNDDHWSFNNENELISTLKEVANLIADKLLDWFEDPVSNPANIRSSLNDEQQKRMLKENAEGYERDAIRLRAERKIDEANRFEEAAQAYRDQLSKLE